MIMCMNYINLLLYVFVFVFVITEEYFIVGINVNDDIVYHDNINKKKVTK